MITAHRIHGGERPEDVPAYTVGEAASLVAVPLATLRSWVFGRTYPAASGPRRSRPVIEPPKGGAGFLSFTNVVEAHVLASMRRKHKIELQTIRRAVVYVRDRLHVQHPLAHEKFKTDGVNLFVQRLQYLINVSAEGQLAMREILDAYLQRVEYERGRAVRFFPLHRGGDEESPRVIVVDPRRAFGRPVLEGTGVPVSSIRSRFEAGDDIEVLAKDYGIERRLIEEALRATSTAA